MKKLAKTDITWDLQFILQLALSLEPSFEYMHTNFEPCHAKTGLEVAIKVSGRGTL